jgi:hypothetical protein
MNDTLKTILVVSVSMVLILVVFLGGYLLGRFSGPYQHNPRYYEMGWSMSPEVDCPHERLPYPHRPGSGMFDENYPDGGFYHHEGMPFWGPRGR